MFTVQRKKQSGNRSAHLVARIVLSNGTIAGEGYAQMVENALYNAVKDAHACGYTDAANGHARLLDETARAYTSVGDGAELTCEEARAEGVSA